MEKKTSAENVVREIRHPSSGRNGPMNSQLYHVCWSLAPLSVNPTKESLPREKKVFALTTRVWWAGAGGLCA